MKQNDLIPELAVHDLDVSLRFYLDVIGFEMVYSRPEEGFAFLQLSDSQLMLDQIDLGRTWRTASFDHPLGRGVNFQIRVDGVQTVTDRLAAAGLEPYMATETKWYRVGDEQQGQRQVLIQDPDGYLLRLFETLG